MCFKIHKEAYALWIKGWTLYYQRMWYAQLTTAV